MTGFKITKKLGGIMGYYRAQKEYAFEITCRVVSTKQVIKWNINTCRDCCNDSTKSHCNTPEIFIDNYITSHLFLIKF